MNDMRIGWEEENFKNAYLNWIEREMHGKHHRILFDILYDTEFEWDDAWVPMDENREADGRYLRNRFASESGIEPPPGYLDWPASLLEVLVALAIRIEEQLMYDPLGETGAHIWFWEWLHNVGLDRFDDHEMLDGSMLSRMTCIEKIGLILHRRYSYSGEGGLFPLNDPGCDQRREEMWFQANSYMGERYFEM